MKNLTFINQQKDTTMIKNHKKLAFICIRESTKLLFGINYSTLEIIFVYFFLGCYHFLLFESLKYQEPEKPCLATKQMRYLRRKTT